MTEKHILPASVVQDVIGEMNFTLSCVHQTNGSVFRTILDEHNLSPVNERLLSMDS